MVLARSQSAASFAVIPPQLPAPPPAAVFPPAALLSCTISCVCRVFAQGLASLAVWHEGSTDASTSSASTDIYGLGTGYESSDEHMQ